MDSSLKKQDVHGEFTAASVSKETEPDTRLKGFSIGRTISSSATIAGTAILLHFFHAPTALAMAFYLLVVFSVARISGWLANMVASVVGAFALSLLYMPPIGSIRIEQPGDKFALTLFVAVSIAAYPMMSMIGSRKMVKIQG